jgi:hypothetical protein
MSEKNLVDDSDDGEEEDDDYSPNKNENDGDEEHSDTSEETEHDADESNEEKKETEANIKSLDESKVDELWKSFTSTTSNSKTTTTAAATDSPKPVTKVVDYAGEKVTISVPTPPSLKRPAASSSASVLDRLGIGKKQKISTLEKSRLDWAAHKESESLTDDLDSHRRGKDSYVERKAFLERSELRQHDHFLTNVKKK